MSCPSRSRKLWTYTQKELETVWAAPELLGVPTIGRGKCLVRGWWWRRSQKSNKPSKPPEIYENGEKTGGFAHVLANKSLKTPFFSHKYLTRYTHETFFEEYMNFKTHYFKGQSNKILIRFFFFFFTFIYRPRPKYEPLLILTFFRSPHDFTTNTAFFSR